MGAQQRGPARSRWTIPSRSPAPAPATVFPQPRAIPRLLPISVSLTLAPWPPPHDPRAALGPYAHRLLGGFAVRRQPPPMASPGAYLRPTPPSSDTMREDQRSSPASFLP